MELTLRTRNPKTNEILTASKTIDPTKTCVMIIDSWNYHWCMTATQRVVAMVPRWNRALECARKLGMTVIWAPSDAANQYAGSRQRERARGVRYEKVPKLRDLTCEFTCPFTFHTPCMCGPGIHCHCNYGWDGICPDLFIAEDDLITCGLEEAYSVCKQRGITDLLFTGLHTNMCLFGKPDALKAMHSAGFDCAVARDINDAFTGYFPEKGLTPDHGTEHTDDDLERAGVPNFHMVDAMRAAGVWHDEWITEYVRLTPWGTEARPYLFEETVTVTLTSPWIDGAEFRYTLDGAVPTSDSPLYTEQLKLTGTTKLCAVAFKDGKPVSLPAHGYFVRLPAAPPKPDVPVSELGRIKELYELQSPGHAAFLWQPQKNQSYEGRPLRIRGKTYASGLGMRAPANARFELKPEYDRFVALAGADDHLVDERMGRDLAMHANVIFRVFIDGELAAESPVMRISQEPWRFDVEIPEGSRQINLACMSAGAHHPVKLGNWVGAGFVLRKLLKNTEK